MGPDSPDQGADSSGLGFVGVSGLLVLFRVSAVILILGGVGLGLVAVNRALLPYNEEGRYFDAEASVVYHQDTAPVYGILAVTGLGGVYKFGIYPTLVLWGGLTRPRAARWRPPVLGVSR